MNPQLDWCAPDACSLPLDDQPDRMAEWDELFRRAVRTVSGMPDGVRFLLDRDQAVPAQVADLADREAQCCSFLTFGLTVGASLTLEVTADPGHGNVVTAFAARATTLSRSSGEGSGDRASG